jgi:HK97 gp10 family phage protein
MPADVSELELLAAQFKAAATPVRKAARDTVKDTTKKVEEAARNLVPVDTGSLRASIDSELYGGTSSPSGRVSTGEHYAMFVEYGTSRMAPQPFMTPALEQNEDGFYTDTETAVLDAVNRALGG